MLVTIGLCVKDCEATIKETAESIASQNFPQELTEVILVDDGCVDRTVTIALDRLSESRISVIVLRTNHGGLGEARQIVVDNARGKYVIWVDGDITLSRDYMQRQVEFMETHPDVGKARGKWKWMEKGSLVSQLENMRASEYRLRYTQKEFDVSMLVGLGGAICRLEALKQGGGFDQRIIGAGEDIDIATRMMKSGWRLSSSEGEFQHKTKETWRDLWDQYFWYGYGSHIVNHKHGGVFPTWTRTPLLALLLGLIHSSIAYKITNRKTCFLLPLQYFFKQTAWCLGFVSAHFEGYGHLRMRG